MRTQIKLGDVVRIRPEVSRRRGDRPTKATAVVRGMVYGVTGGVWLDRMLQGFKGWNVADLIVVRASDKTARVFHRLRKRR